MSYHYQKGNLASIKPTASWSPASVFFQTMKFMVFGAASSRLIEID